MTRRGFFEKIVAAILGASGLAFLAPALAYLYPNRNFAAGTRQFVDATGRAISAEEVAEGGFLTGLIQGSPAVVFRRNQELVAFSTVCTHLGCIVSYESEDEVFVCPCHGGEYDVEGNVLDGPPPKPLTRLQVKIAGGKIELS